jgi:hypothetical protein
VTAPAVDKTKFSPEMKAFLVERDKNANHVRINKALFDRAYMLETDVQYLREQAKFEEWLEKKLSKPLMEHIKESLFCPLKQDIPDQPIIIPSRNGEGNLCDLSALEQYSRQKGLWENGKYENPFTRQQGFIGDLLPAYGTQSLIERLINRLYEFRAEKENNPDSSVEVKRYQAYRDTAPNNAQRMQAALNDAGSLRAFIRFIQGQEDVIKIVRQPEVFQRLAYVDVQDVPQAFFKIGDKAEPDYDAQNQFEQLINLAQELQERFAARPRERSACSVM